MARFFWSARNLKLVSAVRRSALSSLCHSAGGTCADGYVGHLCNSCKDGWYRTTSGCSECGFFEVSKQPFSALHFFVNVTGNNAAAFNHRSDDCGVCDLLHGTDSLARFEPITFMIANVIHVTCLDAKWPAIRCLVSFLQVSLLPQIGRNPNNYLLLKPLPPGDSPLWPV